MKCIASPMGPLVGRNHVVGRNGAGYIPSEENCMLQRKEWKMSQTKLAKEDRHKRRSRGGPF